MSTATLPPPIRSTIADLMKHEGKAELIGGRIVTEMPAGKLHARLCAKILVSLFHHCESTRCGMAFGDNAGYRVEKLTSGRESFSPDVGLISNRDDPDDPGFIDGAPAFAVEVRSPDQYVRAAEKKLAAKRDDYFEAGTLAVWDVDPNEQTVTLYVANKPSVVFRRGEVAHAEPAVPGWTMPVDDIFG